MSIEDIIKNNNKKEFEKYLIDKKQKSEDFNFTLPYYLLLEKGHKELINIFLQHSDPTNLLSVDNYGLNLLENCLEFNRNDVIPLVVSKLLDLDSDDFTIFEIEDFITKCVARNNYIIPSNLLKYKPKIEIEQLNFLLFLAVVNEDISAIKNFHLYGAVLDCKIQNVSLYTIVLENNLKKINTLFKKLKGNSQLEITQPFLYNEEEYRLLSNYIENENLIYFRYYIGKYGRDILYKIVDGKNLITKIKSNKNNILNNINLIKK